MAAPHGELESALLVRLPQIFGVPFVRSFEISFKAGKARGMTLVRIAEFDPHFNGAAHHGECGAGSGGPSSTGVACGGS
jgi:hypothetical protein